MAPGEKQPHIQCAMGAVASSILLPGDPGRVQAIAECLDDWHPVAENREFRTITGTYRDMPVSATSTGIGGPSLVIAVEELVRVGATTLVRVGSCGAMQPQVRLGQLVVAEAAVREDGASRMYVTDGYPAAAHPSLVLALKEAAKRLGRAAHVGIVRSHDSFYTDQESALMRHWAGLGVLASDMETAPLLTVARLRGARAASILNVVVTANGNLEGGIQDLVAGEALVSGGQKASIQVALEALYNEWANNNVGGR